MDILGLDDSSPSQSVVDDGTPFLHSTDQQTTPNDSILLLNSNLKPQEGIDVSLQSRMCPAPLTNHPSPMAEIKHNALRSNLGKKIAVQAKPAVAIFMVPGDPHKVDGVIKAVYDDLVYGNKTACIELRGSDTSQYIRIEVGTEEVAEALAATAQQRAEIHLSDHNPVSNFHFVEPPSTDTEDVQVVVTVDDVTKWAHHSLQVMSGTRNLSQQVSLGNYHADISGALCKALQDAAGLYSSMALRVHLGHYLQKSYKAGTHTLDQFDRMIKNPRATGRLNTRLGLAPITGAAGLSIEAVIGLIGTASGSLLPTDTQTPTAAHVRPAYVLEAWHNGNRYETHLAAMRQPSPVKGHVTFKPSRVRMIPRNDELPRFEITSISVGRMLDWKITALDNDDESSASSIAKNCLEKASAVMRGSPDNFRAYPVFRLVNQAKLGEKFKSATMKSVYRFAWKHTGCIVQFTINRRWPNIAEMTRSPPTADFELTIYAEKWDAHSSVNPGETIETIWSKDLSGLLCGGTEREKGSAVGRVGELVKTILEIRDFFAGSKST